MDISPTTTKRPKLSSVEEEEMAAATPSNAMPDEIVLKMLSFLSVDDLFPSLCVVSKQIRQECLKLLDEHCKEHHPTLILMEQVQLNRNPSSSTIKKRWLTYPRYRLFREGKECGLFLGGDWPVDIRNLAEDGEMILDISTPTGVPLMHDIQRLDQDGRGCRLAINNFPCSGKDMRTGNVKHLNLRVRVLMRRISTGETFVVMNQTKPFVSMHVDDNGGWEGFLYSGDQLSSDSTFLRVHVTFYRCRTCNGEIAFTNCEGRAQEAVNIVLHIS